MQLHPREGSRRCVAPGIVEQRHSIADERAEQGAGEDVTRIVHIGHHAKGSGGGGDSVATRAAQRVPRRTEQLVLEVVNADQRRAGETERGMSAGPSALAGHHAT